MYSNSIQNIKKKSAISVNNSYVKSMIIFPKLYFNLCICDGIHVPVFILNIFILLL